jgi:hypothetical protein
MTAKERKYDTPAAFRAALEARLKKFAKAEGQELQRLLRATAFDRFLARLFKQADAPWVLKGGYALERRIKEARATRDLDLTLRQAFGKKEEGSLNEKLFSALAEAAESDLGDYFSFVVGRASAGVAGAPYGGARFPVEARLDGRSFVKFHIDVGAGDAVLAPLEIIKGRDWLGFAGIPAAKYPAISKEQHLAEKIHAYTLPRPSPNMRVRDLVDIVLLIQLGLDKKKVTAAISATFKRRGTHKLSERLQAPPASWKEPFAELAAECGLSKDIGSAFAAANDYLSTLAR